MMAGSFWSAFGARFGSAGSSGLDDLLEKENVTLQELLDHEEVIQECKYMNSQLLEHLSKRENVEQMIKYVITIPEDELGRGAGEKDKDKEKEKDKTKESGSSSSSESTPTVAPKSSEDAKSPEDSASGSSSSEAPPPPPSSSSSESSSPPTVPSSPSDIPPPPSSAPPDGEDDSSIPLINPSLPNGDGSASRKYPYVASELFACEVMQMLDVMFEYTELLDLLFSFLDYPPPMDPSHASYFRKVLVVLIQKKYEPLVKYIQEHGIIDKLVNHIGLYSIMELLIMIGWDDGLGQVNDVEWLYKENLIPKLVAKLSPEWESHTDVHMNAARALVDVVVKCPPAQQNLLITHLSSTPVLQSIFHHMFSGCMSSLTNSMSIIIVLVQRYANRRVELGEDKLTSYDDFPEGEEEELTDEPFVSLMPHLSKIIDLLKQPQPNVKVQFGKAEPFGETRMKVVELTLVLLRSRLRAVDKWLAKLNVLGHMVDSFFLYPWNNMLHGLVESIIRTVLDSESKILISALFDKGLLVDKFIEAYEKGDNDPEFIPTPYNGTGPPPNTHTHSISSTDSSSSQVSILSIPSSQLTLTPTGCPLYRAGYMGHLLRTAVAIEEICGKSDADRLAILGSQENVDKWNRFVSIKLEKENEKQKIMSPFAADEAEAMEGLQFDAVAAMGGISAAYMGGKDGAQLGMGMGMDMGMGMGMSMDPSPFHSSWGQSEAEGDNDVHDDQGDADGDDQGDHDGGDHDGDGDDGGNVNRGAGFEYDENSDGDPSFQPVDWSPDFENFSDAANKPKDSTKASVAAASSSSSSRVASQRQLMEFRVASEDDVVDEEEVVINNDGEEIGGKDGGKAKASSEE